jgi:CRISPR-associated protein Cmr3
MGFTDYFITLKPLAPFYFGQELGYELGNKNNYFQHSALFPQQTALLGLLRYQVLLQEGLIPFTRDKEIDAQKLIGEKSFSIDNNENDFKVIDSLSPIFITQGKQSSRYFIRDKEWVNDDTPERNLLELTPKEDLGWKLVAKNHFLEKDYLAKFNYHPYLANEDFSQKIDAGKVVHSSEYTGIFKNWGIHFSDDSYFKRTYQNIYETGDKIKTGDKQIFHKISFINDWSFGFYARFSSTFIFSDEERTVFFGKERSVFKMKVKKIEAPEYKTEISDYFTSITNKSEGNFCKAVLLSDAYIDSETFLKLNESCFLQLTSQTRFRNIQSATISKNYSSKPTLSIKALNLISRGSVFYFEEKEQIMFEKCINNAKEFHKIGYNYYIIQKIKI